MAWNGSGTFSRTNGTHTGSSTWVQDRDAGDYILATRHDTHDQDLADGINACLTKNNETKPTAHFRPNADASYDLGSASLQWKDLHLSGAATIMGRIGSGVAAPTAWWVQAGASITGAATAGVFSANGSVQSGVTTLATGFLTAISTAAGSYTTADVMHFYATQGTIGAGSSVTRQYGFVAGSTLTGATNNYGFYADIAAASGRWNFYANGTAANYFAGEVRIGASSDLGAYALQVTGGAILDSLALTAFANTAITMNTGYTNDSCVVTKDCQGFVHLRGIAYKDIAAVGALLYMTLASGYRPAATVNKMIYNATDGAVRCNIATNGQVTVTHASSNNGNTSFDISFPTT